jgi:hypothetical protein
MVSVKPHSFVSGASGILPPLGVVPGGHERGLCTPGFPFARAMFVACLFVSSGLAEVQEQGNAAGPGSEENAEPGGTSPQWRCDAVTRHNRMIKGYLVAVTA